MAYTMADRTPSFDFSNLIKWLVEHGYGFGGETVDKREQGIWGWIGGDGLVVVGFTVMNMDTNLINYKMITQEIFQSFNTTLTDHLTKTSLDTQLCDKIETSRIKKSEKKNQYLNLGFN